MSTKSFSTSVSKWTKMAKAMPDEIFQEFLRLVYVELMEAIPERTGNLKRSVIVTKDGMRAVDSAEPGKQYTDITAENLATIESAQMGDTVFISVQAPYGPKINYGHSKDAANVPGRFFIETTRHKFRALQQQAIKTVKARYQ